MLSIDETIAREKENAEKLRKIIETGYDGEISIEAMFCDDTEAIKEAYERFENFAKRHEQLAEWLEELKAYKSDEFTKNLQELVYKQGYNKAIDDLLYKMLEKGIIDLYQCNEMRNFAEQLKRQVIQNE